MSEESRRLKICTLVSLIGGLAMAVAGIVLGVTGGFGIARVLALVSSVLALVLGIRGALLANVPSKSDELVRLALAITVVQACLAVAEVLIPGVDAVGENVVPIALTCVALVVALAICLMARGVSRHLLAK